MWVSRSVVHVQPVAAAAATGSAAQCGARSFLASWCSLGPGPGAWRWSLRCSSDELRQRRRASGGHLVGVVRCLPIHLVGLLHGAAVVHCVAQSGVQVWAQSTHQGHGRKGNGSDCGGGAAAQLLAAGVAARRGNPHACQSMAWRTLRTVGRPWHPVCGSIVGTLCLQWGK